MSPRIRQLCLTDRDHHTADATSNITKNPNSRFHCELRRCISNNQAWWQNCFRLSLNHQTYRGKFLTEAVVFQNQSKYLYTAYCHSFLARIVKEIPIHCRPVKSVFTMKHSVDTLSCCDKKYIRCNRDKITVEDIFCVPGCHRMEGVYRHVVVQVRQFINKRKVRSNCCTLLQYL